MFRKQDDKENATQPQQQQTTANSPVFSSNPAQQAAPKPATPSFGSFGNPSAEQASAEPKKPVTAPLTTQQVGLGTPGASSLSSAPAQAASKPAAPSAGAAFAPSYNKIPSPTGSPASIPAAATVAPAVNPAKLEGIEAERRLTVGYGITLTGEVSDCDRLVIYGKVNAKLANVKFLQISDSGKFNGSATIDQAEISGVFEGELKVAHNITITSTGRVNGKITYGSIEIRPGGKFTGEIIEDTTLLDQNSSSDSGKEHYGLYNNQSGNTSDRAA